MSIFKCREGRFFKEIEKSAKEYKKSPFLTLLFVLQYSQRLQSGHVRWGRAAFISQTALYQQLRLRQ